MTTTQVPTAWTITTADAPREGWVGDRCGFSEDGCPCCTCDERSAVRVTWTRERWSRSSKGWKIETTSEGRCEAHRFTEIEHGPSC